MSTGKNIVLNGLGQIGNRSVRMFEHLILVPFFLTCWGVAYYGEWITLTIIPSVLAFSDLGFGTAISNSFVLTYSKDKKEDAADIYRTGMVITTFIVIVGIILSMLIVGGAWQFNMFNSSVIDPLSIFVSLVLMMSARLINFYAQLHEGLFRAKHKANVAYNYFTIEGFIRITFGLICLSIGCGVVGYAVGQFFVAIFFNTYFAVVSNKEVSLTKGRFKKVIATKTFKTGIGFMLTPIWQSFYMQGSTFAVRFALGPEAVAIFNTVRSVCQSVNSGFTIVNGAVFPEIQLAYGRNDMNTAKKIMCFSLQFVTVLSLLGMLFLILFGPQLYRLWTQSSIDIENLIFYIFMFGIPFNAVWWTSGSVFKAINKPLFFSVLGVISAIISTVFVYILSVNLGLIGAAIGFIIMDICMVMFVLPLSNKEFGITVYDICNMRSFFVIANTYLKLKKIDIYIMEIQGYIIRIAKKGYRLFSNKKFLNPECDINRKSSNDKIYALLSKGKPCLISRFGTVEINCIVNYLCVNNKDKSYIRRIWDYISDKTGTPWWEKDHFQPMCNNAGVFPPSVETATKFSEQYLVDIPEIDLLGCHQYYEKFMPLRDDVVKVQLEMLYPFFVERPWTRYLKGKRVLVVHPFADTIRKQYEKRELLFNNQDCLPAFELITYKSVQSIGGSEEYRSWFDALEKMEQDIKIIDFDVCLIGCGAYGLPLGAFVKRLGKQAIHIGGGLQLLFGIKGGRWEAQHYSGIHHYNPGIDIDVRYYNLFNEYWVRPSADETPLKAKDVENSCYW